MLIKSYKFLKRYSQITTILIKKMFILKEVVMVATCQQFSQVDILLFSEALSLWTEFSISLEIYGLVIFLNGVLLNLYQLIKFINLERKTMRQCSINHQHRSPWRSLFYNFWEERTGEYLGDKDCFLMLLLN